MGLIVRQFQRLRGQGAGATLARGSAWAFLISLLGVALMYLLQIALAHWLGASGYGTFAFAWSWAQVLAFLIGVGLPTAALRYVPQYLAANDPGRLRGLLASGQLFIFVLGALLAAAGTGIVLLIEPKHWPIDALIAGLCLTPLLGVMTFQRQAVRGAQRAAASIFPWQVLYPLVILVLCGGVMLWLGTLTPAQALFATVASAATVVAVYHLILRRTFAQQIAAHPMTFDFRVWIGVALPLLLVQQSIVLLNQTDVLMIGMMMNPHAVGIYNAAARTANLPSVIQRAVNLMATPMIASFFYSNRRHDMHRIVVWSTRWVFWGTLVIGLGMIVAAPWVLSIFGESFTQGVTTLRLLIGGKIINAAFGPTGPMLSLLGQHRRAALVYGVSAGLNVVLNAALIPVMGIEGAALATVIALTLRRVWAYYLVRKYVHAQGFAFGLSPRKNRESGKAENQEGREPENEPAPRT